MNETDLLKLKSLNACKSCDLSDANLENANLTGANFSGADLSGTDLTTSKLKNAKLDGVIYCHTMMPWGEIVD